MKKLYLLLFLALLANSAYARKIGFTDAANRWTITEPGAIGYVISGWNNEKDSSINGLTYTRNPWGWFREDAATRKIYYLKDPSATETVFYDFGMSIGDSIVHTTASARDTFVLTHIDSILINGSQHLVQYFSPLNAANVKMIQNVVVEGIGRLANTPFLEFPHVDAYIPLTCFSANGQEVVVPNPEGGNFIDNRTCTLGIPDKRKNKVAVTIAPHPANSATIITLPQIITGHIRITNTLGQTVMQQEVPTTNKVTVGTLPASGIYMYHITSRDGSNIATGRLVYE